MEILVFEKTVLLLKWEPRQYANYIYYFDGQENLR